MSVSSSAPAVSARVLIIEDERKMRESIAKAVRLESWHAAEAARGTEAIALLGHQRFDLVLLDWMLPDRDGLELLKEIRAVDGTIRVLMLTARDSTGDKITGLDSGADDYLAKPFSMVELIARCRVLLRRPPPPARPVLACGELELHVRDRMIKRGAAEIPLTPQETDLLECLLSHQGEIVTRDMLERAVWRQSPRHADRDNVLDVLILRVRQKIEEAGGDKTIQTLRGIGYRLVKP